MVDFDLYSQGLFGGLSIALLVGLSGWSLNRLWHTWKMITKF
jgi:hypothetical protein